jgi:hypothetical protein
MNDVLIMSSCTLAFSLALQVTITSVICIMCIFCYQIRPILSKDFPKARKWGQVLPLPTTVQKLLSSFIVYSFVCCKSYYVRAARASMCRRALTGSTRRSVARRCRAACSVRQWDDRRVWGCGACGTTDACRNTRFARLRCRNRDRKAALPDAWLRGPRDGAVWPVASEAPCGLWP